jgi:hypothetical protein
MIRFAGELGLDGLGVRRSVQRDLFAPFAGRVLNSSTSFLMMKASSCVRV